MIFIPGSVPSSKNSRVWTGKHFIASKSVRKWRDDTAPYWIKYKQDFLDKLDGVEKPYKISMKFVRGTKHRFDYINPAQTIQDEMVKYGWIEDDDASNMIPVFLEFEYNKTKPGVYVDIIR